MQFDRTPAEVWRRYERDRDYKRSIGLYDRVRRNEAFYLGRQWEGLRVQSLDPLIFNVLRRCVNLFVAMLVSDDVAVRVTPFDMDENGRHTAKVLERAFASAIERSGVKALGRPLLKNACVDGDACFYMHFDPALETGQAVKGDISVDLIDHFIIAGSDYVSMAQSGFFSSAARQTFAFRSPEDDLDPGFPAD